MITNNELIDFRKNLSVSQTAVRTPRSDEIVEGRYLAKLARTPAEVTAALRLRYEVFSVELGAPNAESAAKLEYDEYDAVCKHLIVIDLTSKKVVGTYRLNSIEAASTSRGFYAFGEFSIEDLPREVLRQSIEIGRACIAREHRNSKVLFILWKALLNHLVFSQKRYFFGCCSLFTQDCALGAQIFQRLAREGCMHPKIKVQPRRVRTLPLDKTKSENNSEAVQTELPSLFNLYLKIGAKICGAPSIDREFKTIDFFVIFDLLEMSKKYQKIFFRPEFVSAKTACR